MESVDSLGGSQGKKYILCQEPLGVFLYICMCRYVTNYIHVVCMYAYAHVLRLLPGCTLEPCVHLCM